jgi:hypothetical protein
VVTATRALAAAMDLRFGAFDFLTRDTMSARDTALTPDTVLTRDAMPVFLEANPDGDWRWAERKSGAAVVTPAAARMLADLHHQVRHVLPPALGGGVRPLDLLAFLSPATSRRGQHG